jgi:hypothetical protein
MNIEIGQVRLARYIAIEDFGRRKKRAMQLECGFPSKRELALARGKVPPAGKLARLTRRQ